jgi:pimeloyl-ACP methyl ester carboxylesterase
MTESQIYLDHLRKVIAVNGMDVSDIALPDEREIELHGISIHYHDWGNPAGAPVVFLHGGGLTAHTWDAVCLGLRADYHCVAIDFRGHGDSEWSEDYRIDAYVQDVRAFLDATGLKQINLVGMSMGGLVAVRYAGRFQDLCSLVVIDIGPEMGQEKGAQRIQAFIDAAELDSIDDFVERALAFNPRRNPDMLRASLRHNLRQLPNGKWTWKYDPSPFRRSRDPQTFVEFVKDTWAFVPHISCPVLVVRGAESDVLTADVGHTLADSFASGEYVEVARAGHTVQGDNPADLTRELLHFLSNVTVRPS